MTRPEDNGAPLSAEAKAAAEELERAERQAVAEYRMREAERAKPQTDAVVAAAEKITAEIQEVNRSNRFVELIEGALARGRR